MAAKFPSERDFWVRKWAIVNVLVNNNIRAIMTAFTWISTPQGVGYWRNRHDGKSPLTEEDRAFLRRCLHTDHPDDDGFQKP